MAVFRVPKHNNFTVMSNHHLRDRTLSLKAKGLFSLMLSLPEDWDYTLAGLAYICRDGLCSIRGTIIELEGHGYLRRQRLRNEKGHLTDTEYTILELPEPPVQESASDALEPRSSPVCDNRIQAHPPICDFPTLDFPMEENPTFENRTQLNIHKNKNVNKLSTHPINPPGRPMDSMDGYAAYSDLISDNIAYDLLSQQYGQERMDEVVDLMLEAVLSRRDTFRIAGDDFPSEAVRSRMLKVTSQHVEYVFDCLDRNVTKIRNIKAYLQTSLYNAPATMDSFYRAEVNHDLYGGGRV